MSHKSKLIAYYRGRNKKEIDFQRECIEKWLKEKMTNFSIYKEFVDIGYSGMDDNRPKFKEMLKSLDDVDVIIVYHWNKLTRDAICSLKLIKLFHTKNKYVLDYLKGTYFPEVKIRNVK